MWSGYAHTQSRDHVQGTLSVGLSWGRAVRPGLTEAVHPGDRVRCCGLAAARRQLENRPAGTHGPFGAEVEVPPDAPAIDRLAGFLGRTV